MYLRIISTTIQPKWVETGGQKKSTAIGIHKAKGQFIERAVLMSRWGERIIGILQEVNARPP